MSTSLCPDSSASTRYSTASLVRVLSSSNFIVFPFCAVSGLFFSSLERQREKTRRNGAKGRTEAGGGWQGVSESAVSDKPLLFHGLARNRRIPKRPSEPRPMWRPPEGGRSGEKSRRLQLVSPGPTRAQANNREVCQRGWILRAVPASAGLRLIKRF